MGNTTRLKGTIEWNWVLEGKKTPQRFRGDVESAFLRPGGILVVNYRWQDDYGEGKGGIRLQNVPGTNEFVGNGSAGQCGLTHTIAAVRCDLVRLDDKHWELRGSLWRESKETNEWKAVLTFVDTLPFDPELED